MKWSYLLFLCFCCAVTAPAQNWPAFRGEKAAGVADGRPLPVTWDIAKGENIVWKTPIPGLAHASPVVWGNRVFITTAISAEAKLEYVAKDRSIKSVAENIRHEWRMYCLDKKTGKVLWSHTAHEGVPRAKRHLKATQANATPVTDGRYIIALMGSEGMFAYDFTGKLLWKKDLGVMDPGYYGQPDVVWGHANSPIIYKDLVIVQCDGHKQSFIAAYNLKDGREVWRTERNEITSWSTPTVYEGRGRAELIANGSRFIRGYDPLTGKELWRFNDEETQVKQLAPIIAQDLIIVAGGNPAGRPIYAFRPGATGEVTRDKLAWRTEKGSPYTPTPIAYGAYLYTCGDSGVFSAWRIKTGELVYQQRVPSSFSASPVAGDGKIYLPSEDGDLFVVRAGEKFELLAKNAMGEPLMATPAISDGLLIVRSQHHVFAIGALGARRASK
jgi:outer membrane protein assembly factor BamB